VSDLPVGEEGQKGRQMAISKDYEFNLLEERLHTIRVEEMEILIRQQEILTEQAKRVGCSCLFIINDKKELYRSEHTKCKIHAKAEQAAK
jgi:hypothetical protein